MEILYVWGDFDDHSESEVKKLKERGQAAIDVMERHLGGKEWFVGKRFSIADIALYAYTSAAEAIGFEIGENVRKWLWRVKSQDGHVSIKNDPTGKCPL